MSINNFHIVLYMARYMCGMLQTIHPYYILVHSMNSEYANNDLISLLDI